MKENTVSINAVSPSPQGNMTAKQHSNFDYIHLNSARLFVDLALAIDNDPLYQESAPQDIIDSYMSYVSSVIICSVAALESTINQIIVDRRMGLSTVKPKCGSIIFSKYDKLKPDKDLLGQLSEISTVMLKYDVVSFLLNEKIIPHNKLKEDTCYLIKIRNALIHFTPEWDNNLVIHRKLESSRKNRFTDCHFHDSKALFFPYRCLSGSCASWSYNTASSFIEIFNSIIS